MKTGHQIIRLRRRGPGSRVSSQTTPSGSTANVAAALTPPTIATASPESIAIRRGDPSDAPLTNGSRTHGAMALGQASMEIGPRVLSIRGDNANAKPAARQARSERTPRARASRAVPTNATIITSAIQSLWTTQPWRSRAPPSAKNGPMGHR